MILIFSVNGSKEFQGYARMVRESRPDDQGIRWIIPSELRNQIYSNVIEIDWINWCVNMAYPV